MDLTDGKPGAGKGRFFAELGVEKLVAEPETVIITNFAFEILPWVNGLGQAQIGLREFLRIYHRQVKDVEKKIYFLTDEQCLEFYRWRVDAEGKLFAVDAEKNEKGIVQSFDIDVCLRSRPVMYLIDEAGQMFGSRNWQNTGTGVMFYSAQHRKLGDDTHMASQSYKDIDVALVRKCQHFNRCRNRGKLRVGIFRQPEDFKVHVYENPPSGSVGQVPMLTRTFKDDARGRHLLQTFDTTAGVGMRKGRGRGDIGAKKSGIPWKYFIAGMVLVPLVVFVLLNFGMRKVLNFVEHKNKPAVGLVGSRDPGGLVGRTSSLPVKGAGVLGGVFPQGSSGVDPSQAPVVRLSPSEMIARRQIELKKLPYWNLDGDTNLLVTGWVRWPGFTRISLSNGHDLPLNVVHLLSQDCVVLNDGTILPVVVTRSRPVSVLSDVGAPPGESSFDTQSAPTHARGRALGELSAEIH